MREKYRNIIKIASTMSSSELGLVESFVEMLLVERSSSHNTISSYLRDLMDLAVNLHTLGVFLQNATNLHLEDYASKIAAREITATTLSRKISSIKQFYGFLLRDEILISDPSLHLVHPKIQHNIPKPIATKQIEKLLHGTKSYQDGRDSLRNMLIIELLYATGMRISELVTLKMSAFDNLHSKGKFREIENINIIPIIVNGKGNKERTVLLHARVLLLLVAYLDFREKFILPQLQVSIKETKPRIIKCEWVFPSRSKSGAIAHITRQRCFQILKDIATLVGIQPSTISPHKIRHSFATHMLQNGADLRIIQELLGHASINSTQIYTKVNDQSLVVALNENHPLAQLEILDLLQDE